MYDSYHLNEKLKSWTTMKKEKDDKKVGCCGEDNDHPQLHVRNFPKSSHMDISQKDQSFHTIPKDEEMNKKNVSHIISSCIRF